MIKFGPSGVGDLFAQEGRSKTIQAPSWLAQKGLTCFEYSFGRGVLIKEDTAKAIGAEFFSNNIEISVHAPYFINLATDDAIKMQNNSRYILGSLEALKWFGGNRCVLHAGSPLKLLRSDAMKLLLKGLESMVLQKAKAGFEKQFLCVETMGKINQLGDLDEVISMCKIADDIIPCLDFGHLNARTFGGLSTRDDFCRVLEKCLEGVGAKKFENTHIHFSKIEYSKGGEVRHLTFSDDLFGPKYEHFIEAILQFDCHPYIICESSGTQTEDAIAMQAFYNKIKISL